MYSRDTALPLKSNHPAEINSTTHMSLMSRERGFEPVTCQRTILKGAVLLKDCGCSDKRGST